MMVGRLALLSSFGNFSMASPLAWRIIPVSKWLITVGGDRKSLKK